ncbi:hypothetical protein BKA63DRAFT_207748 [Paraphoma chrysanthemicola]|nr:hypothetical protein BKA63DRAFT_207748 [Paraphoma chrysanthemicola]
MNPAHPAIRSPRLRMFRFCVGALGWRLTTPETSALPMHSLQSRDVDPLDYEPSCFYDYLRLLVTELRRADFRMLKS